MSTTGTDDENAAQLLAQLHHFFREHPVTGAAGHSYMSSAPRSTPTTPGAPGNLAVIDHINASVRELVDHTRAANPEAGPLPARVEAVYSWCVENTANAPEDMQLRRDTIVYRQKLEHAIALGDHKVVRPHRCPACRTLGLFWRPEMQRALCTNGRCLTKDGLSNRWTLERLAYEHVARMYEKAVRGCAT